MNKLHIVMCFDKNVIVGVLTHMLSIQENNKNIKCIFHLCGIGEDLKKFLSVYSQYSKEIGVSLDDIYCHNIEDYKIYKDVCSDLKSLEKKGNRNLTVATFYRLIVFDNIPLDSDQDRLVYFDTDMICNGDISFLTEFDFKDKVIAAVPDFPFQMDYAKKELSFIGDNYFNAGFLAINIKLWRENNYGSQVIKYLLEKMPKQFDQDVLNVVCANKVLWLPQKYNSCVNHTAEPCDDAIIIHYTGADKPWKPWSMQKPSVEIYRNYLKKLEPNTKKWFSYDNNYKEALSVPSSIHDFKMVSKILRKEHKYLESIKCWLAHLKLKIKKKGFLFVLIGK